ncbi:MAG: sulfotransferase family 2 domain-containing protein [Cyanobacteriota bacterium]|nr:sulfotransferase family 2 domain-containing protein [Cyanobacteriota bacterium]
MAPRTLVSRIDAMVICASPKASCRSVADFAWAVRQHKRLRVPMRMRLIVFRNPLRRLISAYLNKYVEHSRYREDSLALCPSARLDCFADFLEELDRHGFRCIDQVHFKPQRTRYRWWSFDRIFDADNLEGFRLFVNTLCGTDQEMPCRVGANRPQAVPREALAGPEGSPSTPGPQVPPWAIQREELRRLMENAPAPPYASFFTPSLEAIARRVYAVDFRFLEQARRKGLLDESLFAALTRL